MLLAVWEAHVNPKAAHYGSIISKWNQPQQAHTELRIGKMRSKNRPLKHGLVHTVSTRQHTHFSEGPVDNIEADIHMAPWNSVGRECIAAHHGLQPHCLGFYLFMYVGRGFIGAEVGACVRLCACVCSEESSLGIAGSLIHNCHVALGIIGEKCLQHTHIQINERTNADN